MTEGHGEIRIAHQHGSARLSFKRYRSNRQAIEGSGNIEIYLVGTLFKSLDRKIGLS